MGKPRGRPCKLYEIDGFKAPAKWWARQINVTASAIHYHARIKKISFQEAYYYLKFYQQFFGRYGYNIHKPRGFRVVPRRNSEHDSSSRHDA